MSEDRHNRKGGMLAREEYFETRQMNKLKDDNEDRQSKNN